MDWSDSPDQAQFRSSVRALIEKELPKYYREKVHIPRAEDRLGGSWQTDMCSDDPVVSGAARTWAAVLQQRGFAAPNWPKEYGGGGLSPMQQFILHQELEEAQAPLVGGQGAGMLGPTLLMHGTDEQKRKYLPKTLTGEYLWAQGFSEPGAGSDLASLTSRAVLDGDEYVINGQKLWTSNAHRANWIFGLFRTDPEAPKHRGISFLVMDMKTPGITVRPIISLGWEHATNETFYEDVHVPADQLVGEANRGWYVAMSLLDFERSNVGGAIVAQRELHELLEHTKTPLGRLQIEAGGLQRQRLAVAQHYVETNVLYNFSMRIVSMQAAGLSPNYEASVSKIFSSELEQRISNTGMRVYGLYSNVWDENDPHSPQQSLFTHANLDTIMSSIAGGANEIQRGIIATRGLGLPRG